MSGDVLSWRHAPDQQPHGIAAGHPAPPARARTTTLYASLGASTPAQGADGEDLIEYQLPGIGQIQVNRGRPHTPSPALRAIPATTPTSSWWADHDMRKPPQIATEASLTGHLVLKPRAPSTTR